MGLNFAGRMCHLPSTFFLSSIMEFLCLSKGTLVDWSLLPQVELVSDSEDDTEMVTVKVRERRQREEEAKRQEEEVKAERQRQEEEVKAERQRQEEEAKAERQRQKEVSPQRSVLPRRC